MYQKYTGVILKKYELGEADELLTVYTKEVGKLRLKSLATRKIKSKLAGHLQSMNEIEFETARKRGRADSLPVLVSVRLKTLNSYLRENLQKFAFALMGAETLYRLTIDQAPDKEVYSLFLNFLRHLGEQSNEAQAVRGFQLNLLGKLGYELNLNQCVVCQENLIASPVSFVVSQGGVACRDCGESSSAGGLDLQSNQISQLVSLSQGVNSPELDRPVENVVDAFLQYVLEREIKSKQFVQNLNK